MTMDEILALLQIAEALYASIERMATAAKTNGDPTTAEVAAQLAAAQAANARVHALLST